MTVIAYKDGVMAADSRSTDEHDMHLTDCEKIVRLKSGALLGGAGDSDDRAVVKLLQHATPRKMPTRKQLGDTHTDYEGILVFPNRMVFCVSIKRDEDNEDEWRGEIYRVTDKMISVGSGKQFAYGAMEAGASAFEAVEITCRRDTGCAIPVQHKLIKGKDK